MKRILAFVLVAAMVFSLAACSKDEKKGDTNNATTAPTQEAEKDNNNTTPSDEGGLLDKAVELTLWDIAVAGDGNRPAYDAALKELKEKYPNVTIKENSVQNDDYKPMIKSAVAANELPDIFFTWSCAFLGDFVSADKVYCLDDTLKPYIDKGELFPVMLNNTTYNGKHYGVPTTMNIVGLFANMDLLAKVGYSDIPATYEDLIACCDKLVAAGIIPFGCAAKEDQTWCVTEYLEPIIEKTIGAKAMNDIFVNGATWDNAGIKDAVDKFQAMINGGYFDPAGTALTNDEVKANFIAGKYAFYQNGTWNCGEFAGTAGLNVKVGEFPVIDSSKSQLGELIGGPSDTLAVAASSANAAAAAAYAAELGRSICKNGYLAGSGLPAWNLSVDDSGINALTKAVSQICNNAKDYVLFGDTAMHAEDAQIYLEYVSKVYGGQLNGEQFVSGLKNDIR